MSSTTKEASEEGADGQPAITGVTGVPRTEWQWTQSLKKLPRRDVGVGRQEPHCEGRMNPSGISRLQATDTDQTDVNNKEFSERT